MTKHVVVGGSGFLGRHLVRALVARGDSVEVVDLAGGHAFNGMDVRVTITDVTRADAADFDGIVGNADVVHHHAWTTIPATANQDPGADLRDNLGITLGLLEALKRRGGGRIVFCSSGGTVYGPPRHMPVAEDHPLNPITAYGVSKLSAEKYLQIYRTLSGIDARVARISNPYGAGQNPERPQGVVSTFVHRALQGRELDIWGDGLTVRDFIHITDVASALTTLSSAPSLASGEMPIFNIGSGEGSDVNSILSLVERTLGRELLVRRFPGRAFDVAANVLDINKAARVLGWSPSIRLAAGVAQMIDDLGNDRSRLFSSW